MNKKVGIVISCMDKILIFQDLRKEQCEKSWELVTGNIKDGESEEMAITRECNEKLGLSLSAPYKVKDILMPCIIRKCIWQFLSVP